MTWRKRHENERRQFNKKLEDSSAWNDKFQYPFISEIIEVSLPKVNVSLFSKANIYRFDIIRFCWVRGYHRFFIVALNKFEYFRPIRLRLLRTSKWWIRLLVNKPKFQYIWAYRLCTSNHLFLHEFKLSYSTPLSQRN